MKKIFAASLLFVSVSVFGQKDFEGIIKYRGIPVDREKETEPDGSTEKKDTFNIEVLFAPGKIRFKASEKEDMIILLDSARVYELNTNNNTYNIRRLRKTRQATEPIPESIAGYPATPFKNSRTIGMFGNMEVWLADSLTFTVPVELSRNEELVMVQNNKIVLKVIIRIPGMFGDSKEEMEEPYEDIAATIIATEVKPGPVDPSLFTIPADFKEDRLLVEELVDTAVLVADTIAVAPPPTPKTKTAPVKKPTPPKSITPTKSPARKQ